MSILAIMQLIRDVDGPSWSLGSKRLIIFIFVFLVFTVIEYKYRISKTKPFYFYFLLTVIDG